MAENITNIPNHVALIMDGNGRWAKKRLMPRSFGHNAGMNAMIKIAEKAKEMGIHYLTVYALSTENLSRPQEELDGLYNLFRKYFKVNVAKLIKGGARVQIIGDVSALPEDIQKLIAEAEISSPKEAEFVFVIALNYGARAEIVRAANRAAELAAIAATNGEKVIPLTEQSLSSYLYTGNMPELDLIIRTGGEKRLSNFLLYQAAYAELYFTDVLFPDFDEKQFELAIEDYSKRTRRFGKV
jgi:undecaprenyl diphosphate synthase